MNKIYDEINKENNSVMDSTNKLLVEMIKNQKDNAKNLIKVFISTIICYTVLLIAMVIGFFVYESQFEVVETQWDSSISQEAISDGSGNAIVNNGGDVNYGESGSGN